MLESFLHTLFGLFIQAETVLFALFFATAVLLMCRKGRLAMGTFFMGIAFFLVAGVSPLGPWALSLLENRFEIPEPLPQDLKGMIVLGGSFDRPLSVKRRATCYTGAAGRLVEAYRLAGRYPHLPVLFTGGGVPLKDGVSEAFIARTIAQNLNFDLGRFTFEDKSKNTYENATFSYELMKPAPTHRWLLVTSAAHMPRAVADFRSAGWNVLPYPVDYKAAPQPPRFGSFQIRGNLSAWSQAMREWAPLARDFLSGKTSVFFPAP